MAQPENLASASASAAASACNSSDDKPWQPYHTVYTNPKAGMEGVDKEKVLRIVYEMSKGSKYFENEERKEAYMKQKIENMRAQSAKLTAADLSHYQKIADKRILELEANRDFSKIWLHVDMDAFYAAVETLADPSLKGKPMAVGGMSMISTANYEARKFGVRAAMPGFIARKLCPELVFVPVDFKKYTHYSDLTRKVCHRYDPNFLATSLDEAYLEITKVCEERRIDGGQVAEELRLNVYNETGLTCSAGVAPNRLLAKVCSDINKPNGQFILPNNRTAVMTFVSSLPIRKIGGIGKVTESILKNALGITTCEEMLQRSNSLCALFSRSSSDFFLSVALGIGGTDTPQISFRKSISNERTFSATSNEVFLYQKLADLAEMLSANMKKGLCGKTLTLKLKTASFEVRTRALTLLNYISSNDDILKHASKLLKAELPVSLRLMGLRMSHFRDEANGVLSDPTQKTLSSFIVSGNSCQQNTSTDDSLSGSEINNNARSLKRGNCVPPVGCVNCESRDSGDNNQIPDFLRGDGDQEQGPENLDTEELVETWIDKSTEINDPGIGTGSIAAESDGNVRPSKRESLAEDLERSSLYRSTDSVLEDIEAGSSLYHKESFFWVDTYKCSLCGVELPPSFNVERQEHFDFHLAERLQDEERGENHKNIMPKQRLTKREDSVNHSKQRKKQKASGQDGKHVPIDKYFVKMNQNFS